MTTERLHCESFDSIREVIVVPAGICNSSSDFISMIILAIDLIYIISNESIYSIMGNKKRAVIPLDSKRGPKV